MVDVTALLAAEDLDDVVLVGHSYGGSVASQVAERFAHVACIEALRCANGETSAQALGVLGGGDLIEAIPG